MENKKWVKQVMIIDDKLHQSYLQTFVEEPLNFEEFVNFELGNLFDEDRKIEQIIPNENATQFVIIYTIKLWWLKETMCLSMFILSFFKRLLNWEWITLYVIQNLFIRPIEWQETSEEHSLQTEVFPKKTQKSEGFKSLRLTLIELC